MEKSMHKAYRAERVSVTATDMLELQGKLLDDGLDPSQVLGLSWLLEEKSRVGEPLLKIKVKELARFLNITRQAAGKVIEALADAEYVAVPNTKEGRGGYTEIELFDPLDVLADAPRRFNGDPQTELPGLEDPMPAPEKQTATDEPISVAVFPHGTIDEKESLSVHTIETIETMDAIEGLPPSNAKPISEIIGRIEALQLAAGNEATVPGKRRAARERLKHNIIRAVGDKAMHESVAGRFADAYLDGYLRSALRETLDDLAADAARPPDERQIRSRGAFFVFRMKKVALAAGPELFDRLFPGKRAREPPR
jgi:hypothetical protein